MYIKRFKDWGIFPKIMSISLVSVMLITAIVLLCFLPIVAQKILNEKKEATQHVVEVAFQSITDYGDKVKAGSLTLDEAQKRAVSEIKAMRYKGKEYFWINDLFPRMIMHPFKPELDGKDLNGIEDPNGKFVFVEFARVAKEKGDGFVDYMWSKPGESSPCPKISYVKLYQPWGWVIGSGIYVDDVKKGIAKLRWMTVLIMLLFSFMTLTLAFFVGSSVSKPVVRVLEVLRRVAHGDLTFRSDIDSKDEMGMLGREVNVMAENLQKIMSLVVKNSSQVASEASQLNSTAEQMAIGVEEVAAQTGTVAVACEEMAATSNEIAQNCSMAAQGSRKANDSVLSGSAVAERTVAVMSRIAGRVSESARTVGSLGSRSDQIGAIISTIEDIADQTNLLALNAAIEAARAGEQGRGFAVVADEVRALAERTTKATREIGEMINAIQNETKGAVAAMEESVKEVGKGTAEAASSGEALQDILNRINEVSMQVNRIASAAEQQTSTTSEISNNIQQITDVVQDTARGAQETATAASHLAGLSEELQRLMGQFKLAA